MVWQDIFIPFNKIHERDRQTERQTDGRTPRDGIGRACIASRGKNIKTILKSKERSKANTHNTHKRAAR